ncbi:MAG: tRNA threonylcarbamoyladenosine dehydratase [Clostridia bacterium]|nr:tRNA threonylcarbamoyladenosine dehydratase [Clostridia bacterium]
MENAFARTELLLGKEGMEKLRAARVAVFGIGGVGGYAVEALVRSGVGALDLVDSDRIAESNLNRQIIALRDTLGQYKVDAAKARALSISPECAVRAYPVFYNAETAGDFDFTQYDYIVDAIDTVSAKIELALRAKEAGVPIISSMGAGNKLDPARFEVADLFKTSVCPLARVMRAELRRRGIKRLKVVYSTEPPLSPAPDGERREGSGRPVPGSTAFVPPVAGLILAGEVIRDLTGIGKTEK